jgi:imidazolonepropionase-like amidohydrolase
LISNKREVQSLPFGLKGIIVKKHILLGVIYCSYTLTSFAAPVLLKGKQYLDVTTGTYIKPANILIDKNKIIAINPQNIPRNIQVIDKQQLTLLPGLMDMHVHLPFTLEGNYQLKYVQFDAATATLLGASNAKKLLYAGFTTVRNVGQIYPGETFVDVALAKASDQGIIDAPHIIPAGHALGITGGHMDPEMVGSYRSGVFPVSYRTGIADGIPEVIKAVRYQIKHGAQVIKVGATAGVLSHEHSVGNEQYSYEELKAIVDEAKRHGVYVAAHAHGTEGINNAIKAGVRSIEHGSLLDDTSIALMKEHGTYLVPTTYLSEGIDFDSLPEDLRKKAVDLVPLSQANVKKAIQAKVKIAFGTDTPVFPHGQNAKEFAALVRRGMSPLEALQTATINAAAMMDITDRGQIKQNYLADIIGVNGDPLKNIAVLEHVAFVMKAGTLMRE